MTEYFKFLFSAKNAIEEGRDKLISDFQKFWEAHGKPDKLALFKIISEEEHPLQEGYQIECALTFFEDAREFTKQHGGRAPERPADPRDTKLIAGRD